MSAKAVWRVALARSHAVSSRPSPRDRRPALAVIAHCAHHRPPPDAEGAPDLGHGVVVLPHPPTCLHSGPLGQRCQRGDELTRLGPALDVAVGVAKRHKRLLHTTTTGRPPDRSRTLVRRRPLDSARVPQPKTADRGGVGLDELVQLTVDLDRRQVHEALHAQNHYRALATRGGRSTLYRSAISRSHSPLHREDPSRVAVKVSGKAINDEGQARHIRSRNLFADRPRRVPGKPAGQRTHARLNVKTPCGAGGAMHPCRRSRRTSSVCFPLDTEHPRPPRVSLNSPRPNPDG